MNQTIFGYEEITDQLLRNFHDNKLHHALLFTGLKGIGKSKLAIKLAVDIIFTSKNQNDLYSGNFLNNPDLLIIQREAGQKQELKKEITIDAIRKINDFTNLTSASSAYRVIIIDAANEMNRNAANALLKILEEPPVNVFLFLISHNSNKLLKTIKSRCNIITFQTPIYQNFKKAINQINPEIIEEQLKNLFIISQGSIGLALEMYQHNALKLYEEIISISDQSQLITKIIHKDFPWIIFTQIISFYLNRLTKTIFRIKINDYISSSESQKLAEQSQNQQDKIFGISDKINKLLSDTKNLNLDKKQSAINIFNLIYE